MKCTADLPDKKLAKDRRFSEDYNAKATRLILMWLTAHQADPMLTPYDNEYIVTYLPMLDAEAEGADGREVAKVVLHIDPGREPKRARCAWETHPERAW